MERVEHRLGVRAGVLGAEEVGPADGADQERAAGEHQHRRVGTAQVRNRVGDVLGRVPRRVEHLEAQPADGDRLAVAHRPVLVAELGARADDVLGAGRRGELPPARHVVVVEMGLDHVADPQAALAGRVDVDVDVAARVDDRGQAELLVTDQGRQVAEPLDLELADEHRAIRPGYIITRPPSTASTWPVM